jgi:hypothetical protein
MLAFGSGFETRFFSALGLAEEAFFAVLFRAGCFGADLFEADCFGADCLGAGRSAFGFGGCAFR